jgi:hypothetical protein
MQIGSKALALPTCKVLNLFKINNYNCFVLWHTELKMAHLSEQRWISSDPDS